MDSFRFLYYSEDLFLCLGYFFYFEKGSISAALTHHTMFLRNCTWYWADRSLLGLCKIIPTVPWDIPVSLPPSPSIGAEEYKSFEHMTRHPGSNNEYSLILIGIFAEHFVKPLGR
jgi:hypothetical protein